MSVFCPKCQKRTYNEYICDYCQYEIKTNPTINSYSNYIRKNSEGFNVKNNRKKPIKYYHRNSS